jgi:hypothetical protein
MYCPGCGARMPEATSFCQICGRSVSPLTRPISSEQAVQRSNPARSKDDELEDLLGRSPVRADRCVICSTNGELALFDFGLARIKVTRNWTETIASAAVSAVSLPLIGFGMVRLPGKTTTTRMFKLRMALCEECLSECCGGFPDPSIHPWFPILWEYGYRQVVPSQAISGR